MRARQHPRPPAATARRHRAHLARATAELHKYLTTSEDAKVRDEQCENWWSWGDSNPRPQAFFEQFYMCSRLF